MCYPCGDFLVGDRDVLLGILDVGGEGVAVWISGPQYEAHYRGAQHTQLVIDVVPGRGGGFSLEAPEGLRFLSRGRVFTAPEKVLGQNIPVITGAAYEHGQRPSVRGQVVAADAATNEPSTPGMSA